MIRSLALALIATVSLTAQAQQTTHAAPQHAASEPAGTPLQAGHGIAPAGQVTSTAHATSVIRASPQLVQRAGPGAASVIPVRSARAQVQGANTLPANATTAQGAVISGATIANGPGLPANAIIPGGSGPNAQLPAPRQPLSDAMASSGNMRITVRAISAAGQGSALDIDGRLAPIDRDLRSFAGQFSYRNYRLLDVQTFELDFRSIAQMELPGARAVAIEPVVGADGKVRVHVELLNQNPQQPAGMKADVGIPRGSTMVIGGYRIDPNAPDGGTLLLAITQDQ